MRAVCLTVLFGKSRYLPCQSPRATSYDPELPFLSAGYNLMFLKELKKRLWELIFFPEIFVVYFELRSGIILMDDLSLTLDLEGFLNDLLEFQNQEREREIIKLILQFKC